MGLRHRSRGFGQSEDGSILVFFGVALAVLMGIVALSFDLGRIAIVQTELQSYADSVALAAAGELDGRQDSISRARAAAAELIADRQTFATGGQDLAGGGDYTLTFHATLPPSDTSAITVATTNSREAAFVRVVVNTRNVDLTFAAAFSALSGENGPDNAVRATAVAGFTQYACDITPLMFCLPSGGFEANSSIGHMIQLRAGGNGAAWGPGNFGFLDPAQLLIDPAGPCARAQNGAPRLRCLIGAIGNVTQCFSQRGVDTEPGQKVGITNGAFNVRFDIFSGAMGSSRNDPDYAPAPNVIKGIVSHNGSACINNEQPSPDTLGLPRDTCLVQGTCGRFGDGNWAAGRVDYVARNYDGIDPHPAAQTRYEYYLAEIAAAGGPGSPNSILTNRAETGRPMCSPHQSDNPERRIVIAAGVDCVTYPINGQENDIPVAEFVRLFLTEPVGQDGSTPPVVDIWAEVVGSAGGEGAGTSAEDGLFRDVVQLYR